MDSWSTNELTQAEFNSCLLVISGSIAWCYIEGLSSVQGCDSPLQAPPDTSAPCTSGGRIVPVLPALEPGAEVSGVAGFTLKERERNTN